MKIKMIDMDLTVCKVTDIRQLDLRKDFFFIAKTDEELSLVCKTEDVPKETAAREDVWRAFRIEGVLDFSLIGILSGITSILAEKQIAVFAVSTYNTDYILVKKENMDKALKVLTRAGYEVQ